MTGSPRARGGLVSLLVLGAACAPALKPVHVKTGGEEEPSDPATLYARIRGTLHDVNAEPSDKRRETLATEAVQLGQRCTQTSPGNPLCEYGLALALGAQARERPATAHDGLALMQTLLQKAAAQNPALDHGGPERVLGLLLVRAPGWPTGPGDPESGLESARKAAARDPEYAPNWLAVAEAADATGDDRARREAAQTAAALAEKAARAGEPNAKSWQEDAKKLLSK